MVEHEYTKEIVCPHCGHEFSDSWEYDEESGEIECYECGLKFDYSRNVSVDYSTWFECPDVGKEHDWGEWSYREVDTQVLIEELVEQVEDFYMRICKTCEKNEFMSLADLINSSNRRNDVKQKEK